MTGAPKSHAAVIYWNLFNDEANSNDPAAFATYASLTDMLKDENRTANSSIVSFTGASIVGSGAFFAPDLPAVPLPAAVWTFLTALVGLGLFGWRSRRAIE